MYGASTIPTAYRLLDEMPAEVLETLKFFLGKKNDPEGDPDSQYVAARYGCPVDSPASVAYEQLRAE